MLPSICGAAREDPSGSGEVDGIDDFGTGFGGLSAFAELGGAEGDQVGVHQSEARKLQAPGGAAEVLDALGVVHEVKIKFRA